ncbi:FkbM family methyltransferase [Pinibacter aurantiacus]|uniref:FkbM family methyltransferase n=1 Tax=Pinibacter aurantiacus TaxID=2851599 RepID=A0A9E2SAG2_9BACT|nr:FkbM family methyltransferase [Pinibacter aurantiacus]MBV4357853.1 FkbM family methyltransferase [Pinibacter aurantiacus]
MLLRSLSNFKGKNRLVKTLYKKTIETATDIRIKGKYNCEYLVPNLKEIIGFSIFADGVYEPETIQLINKLLPQNGCFLDLGANIGAISTPVSAMRPDVKIVSVEAAPWIYAYLKNNIETNGLKNVHIVNKALFDKDDIEIDFYAPEVQFGKGSMAPVFTQNAVKVQAIKVDTLVRQFNIDKVDVIKIDVEGFESFVFNGATELLNRPVAPDIIFEFVDWAENSVPGIKVGAAQEVLLKAGYKLHRIDGDKLTELKEIQTAGSGNMLATKKASATGN